MSQLFPLDGKTQSLLSTEPWYTQVTAQVPGSASQNNISADPVKFAFKPVGETPDTPPSGADWIAGAWDTVTVGTNTVYLAYITIGPNGTVTTLAPGTYVVWIYVNDALGQPVAQVGTLTITEL